MSKNVGLFWWYWLLVVIAGVILFGLALVFLPELMQSFFNLLFFAGATNATLFNPAAVNYITFIYGVLGAVMAGWGIALLLIVISLWRRGESATWYAITASIVSWFVIDSTLSVASGFTANAILNTIFFILFAIPLAATYKQFK